MRPVLFVLCACQASVDRAGSALSEDPLFAHLAPTPWLDSPNVSEQYFPLFVGSTPRELAYGLSGSDHPRLPQSLRARAETQALAVLKKLGVAQAQLQVWPTENWDGQLDWVFARWRADAASAWQWIPEPTRDHAALFDDFLSYDDLYQQPVFANCVFVDGERIVAAWPRTPALGEAYCMNPPARLGALPFAVVLTVANNVQWSEPIDWIAEPALEAVTQPAQVPAWPADFDAQYESDVYVCDGEVDALFPLSGKQTRFTKKGSFQPDNDLEAMVDYLEERYAELGVDTRRQRFTWRGIAQSNLIAILPGSGGGAPVMMADHIDAAVEEDTFAKTGKRVTTKGADDNTTATAALLQAARALRDVPHARDIWLVHLTGEEYPSVDLGARHFLTELMRQKQDLHGVVVMDFIGWHQAGQATFQISPAVGSEHIAALALDATGKVAPELTALYQPRSSLRNAVFQTDLQEFEFRGFAGVLFNENMDYNDESTENPNYHQSGDVAGHMYFPFATAVARVAIETLVRLAND